MPFDIGACYPAGFGAAGEGAMLPFRSVGQRHQFVVPRGVAMAKPFGRIAVFRNRKGIAPFERTASRPPRGARLHLHDIATQVAFSSGLEWRFENTKNIIRRRFETLDLGGGRCRENQRQQCRGGHTPCSGQSILIPTRPWNCRLRSHSLHLPIFTRPPAAATPSAATAWSMTCSTVGFLAGSISPAAAS